MRDFFSDMISLLSPPQRRRAVLVAVMICVMGAVDLLGVASIMPFLAVLGNPQVIETNARLAWLSEVLGGGDPQVFLRVLGLMVFAAVVLSAAVRAGTFYMVTRFTRGVVLDLSNRLLAHYFAQPYEWFIGRHSADLSKTLLTEVSHVVSHSIGPAMRIVANGAIVIALVGLLLWLEPVGAMITAVLIGGVFGTLYMVLRRRLYAIGADRRQAMRERFQIAQESMGGIKEVKLMGLEERYRQRFYGPSRRLARHQAALALVSQMPRYLLEALSFGGVILFVLVVLWTNQGRLEAVLPVIGAFAFAGLKLMPVMQRLFQDVSQIRFGRAALDELAGELAGTGPEAGRVRPGEVKAAKNIQPMGLDRAIELTDVRYRYPGAEHDALRGLSLSIPARSSIGFVGPSGAGKTTLIDILLGLLEPQEGALAVDGVRIGPENVRHWQRTIGYVPQTIYLTDDTIAANIAFGLPAGRIDRDAVERAARMARLSDVVAGLPGGFDAMVGEGGVKLSGGQRQRIGIARALYRDPQVVVFDEAMSALDTITERAVLDAVEGLRGQKTLLTITHRLASVAGADRIFVLEDGRVAAEGRHDEVRRASETYRALSAAAG